MDAHSEATMVVSERTVETTMKILQNGDIEVPMKSDSGIQLGILTIPSKSDYIEKWAEIYQVKIKNIASTEGDQITFNITMSIKNRS